MKAKKLFSAFAAGLLVLFTSVSAFALDLSVGPQYWDVEDLDAAWGVSFQASEPIYKEWVDLTAGAAWLLGEEEDDDFSLVPLDLGLKVHLTSGCAVDPYLLGGASYVFIDNDHDNLPSLDGDWGAYAGAGLAIPVSDSVDIYTDAIFRFVSLDADVGSDVDGHGLNTSIGVAFKLN